MDAGGVSVNYLHIGETILKLIFFPGTRESFSTPGVGKKIPARDRFVFSGKMRLFAVLKF